MAIAFVSQLREGYTDGGGSKVSFVVSFRDVVPNTIQSINLIADISSVNSLATLDTAVQTAISNYATAKGYTITQTFMPTFHIV